MASAINQGWKKVAEVRQQLRRGLVGQEQFVDGLLLGLLAGGHLLIEGVPGLAKTRAVNLLARACQGRFKRIQFTPDLLPADIIGNRIYNQSRGSFETQKGPIFANFILADEINRAPAKVQAALLEAMQEKQVTIGDESFRLEPPFFVFATQNPIEQEGTYPLPEAQVDRFIMKLVVDYPTQQEEQDIVWMVMNETALPDVQPVLDPVSILNLQEWVRRVFIEKNLVHYITDLVQASRQPANYGLDFANVIQYGASPRASIAMAQLARANAFLAERDAVTPDDVKAVAPPVLRHRIIPTYHAEAEGIRSEHIIAKILESVRVP